MTNINGHNDEASLLKASDNDDEYKVSMCVMEQQNRPGCFIVTKSKSIHCETRRVAKKL